METEFEAQFPNIDVEQVRKDLAEIGATEVHGEKLMRRKVYEHPTEKENDWFRVRDEGDKITLSYKKLEDRTISGTKEIEVTVSNFDKACAILEKTKLHYVSYQETKRERWTLDNVEFDIDTWPWIPTFLEIEGKDEKTVRDLSEKLGFKWENAMHGSVENMYQIIYDVTEEEVDDWSEIKFVPIPDWLDKKRK